MGTKQKPYLSLVPCASNQRSNWLKTVMQWGNSQSANKRITKGGWATRVLLIDKSKCHLLVASITKTEFKCYLGASGVRPSLCPGGSSNPHCRAHLPQSWVLERTPYSCTPAPPNVFHCPVTPARRYYASVPRARLLLEAVHGAIFSLQFSTKVALGNILHSNSRCAPWTGSRVRLISEYPAVHRVGCTLTVLWKKEGTKCWQWSSVRVCKEGTPKRWTFQIPPSVPEDECTWDSNNLFFG